jgi:hypothetical protein
MDSLYGHKARRRHPATAQPRLIRFDLDLDLDRRPVPVPSPIRGGRPAELLELLFFFFERVELLFWKSSSLGVESIEVLVFISVLYRVGE